MEKEPASSTSLLTLLGFDYGEKYIGIAVGQTLTKTARALTTVKAKNGVPDWQQIEKLIETWNPERLIVGLPLNMDGSPQKMTNQAKRFASHLRHHFKLPVELMDERLSTVEARASLFEEKGYRALQKSYIDATSAKYILESWLQKNTPTLS